MDGSIPCLTLDHVSRHFGGLRAVDLVSLTVEPGERHAFIGPNGAGKTTLFNLISGELPATEGTITLFGEKITRLPPYRRAARGIARTFQITKLFAELTVLENMLVACEALDRRKFTMHRPLSSYPDLVERAASRLGEFGLLSIRQKLTANISYGDQRKLEVALAMAGWPRLLLLDEPMAGLAPAERDSMLGLLEKLDRSTTVLLVEHDMDVVFGFAEHVTVLHQGKVLATGRRDDVRANPTVQQSYLGTVAPESTQAQSPRRAAPPAGRFTRAPEVGILDVIDIHTYYGNSHVLHGVTLQVERGTVSAVLGRNGVGKTTLCRSLVGLTSARRGRIVFDQVEITRLPPHRISAMRMGLVPQGRRIFSSLTVYENLAIAAREHGDANHWSVRKVFDLFPRLEERRQHRGNELSGGEQQMLAIARALVANPLFLVLDEPTEGLAPALVAEVAGLIRRLKAEGTSILLVEQNAAFTVTVADRVHVMSKGAIVHSSDPAALWENEEIKAKLLGIPPTDTRAEDFLGRES